MKTINLNEIVYRTRINNKNRKLILIFKDYFNFILIVEKYHFNLQESIKNPTKIPF